MIGSFSIVSPIAYHPKVISLTRLIGEAGYQSDIQIDPEVIDIMILSNHDDGYREIITNLPQYLSNNRKVRPNLLLG